MVQQDFSELVFTPSRVRDVTRSYLDELKKPDKPGISIGIGRVDEYISPLRAGELVTILARPGMGKSSLISHYAQRAAIRSAKEEGKFGFPLICSFEMAIEEFQVRRLSNESGIPVSSMRNGLNDGDWGKIDVCVDTLKEEQPIVFIGHSLERKRGRPRLTIENIEKSLEYLNDKYGVTPSLICLDYLQRISIDQTTRDRRTDLNEIIERAKDTAIRWACPLLLGVQAGRSVDALNPPIPTMSSARDTGAVEETSDCVIGLFRPISVYKEGELIPNSKSGLVCTPTLFHLSVLKQRSGESGKSFWLHFDMAHARLSDIELKTYNLNGEDD